MIYSAGYKYRLEEEVIIPVPEALAKQIPNRVFFDNTYVSYDDGVLWIGESYSWDGPSGPMPDIKSSMFGSLIHDAWYQLIREGGMPAFTRPYADRWYGDLCIEDGMWRWVANASVRVLEGYGAEALNNPKKIYSTRT